MSTELHHALPHLGHHRLDDDHADMHELIIALRVANPNKILGAFDALHAQILTHFSFEDALMAKVDFSSKECHIDEHAAVRKSFDEVRVLVLSGRSDVARRFADQLMDWLPEHADALDRQLTKFLFFQATGGAPVMLRR